MPPADSTTLQHSSKGEVHNLLFLLSASMFRMGLALATFEQVRPFDIQLSDFCFFLSLFLFLVCPQPHLPRLSGSRVLIGRLLIMAGGLFSLLNASNVNEAVGPLAKLFILFGLFAPLAAIHSRDIRKNMLFLIGGVFVNCFMALLQAWALPGIVDVFSINPVRPDISDVGRFQGLTSHPNVLGLSAGLAVLIGVGLLSRESSGHWRWSLGFLVFICTLAAFLSGSRTFLVSLIPGLLVFTVLQQLSRRAVVRAVVAIVVLGGGVSYLAPHLTSEYSERFELTGLDYSADYHRLIMAVIAVDEISEKPVLGWGLDHFGEAGAMPVPGTGEILGAHVSLLQYWYGAGVLGAIGFLALFAIPMKQMLRFLKRTSFNNSTNALRVVLSSYVLLFIVSNLHPFLYNRFLYVPLFVFAGFAARLPVHEPRCGTR